MAFPRANWTADGWFGDVCGSRYLQRARRGKLLTLSHSLFCYCGVVEVYYFENPITDRNESRLTYPRTIGGLKYLLVTSFSRAYFRLINTHAAFPGHHSSVRGGVMVVRCCSSEGPEPTSQKSGAYSEYESCRGVNNEQW
jgi:hypothetical protein